MQDLHINIYLFLLVVELTVVLAAASLFFWWRGRGGVELSTQPAMQPQISYAQYLEEEINDLQEILDNTEHEEVPDAEITSVNHKHLGFLKLEHALQQHEKGSESYQAILKDGMMKLFDIEGGDEPAMEDDQESPAGFVQLREIINSQHSAVGELGQNLAERNDEIDGYEEIQAILQTYETQNEALIHCVDMLEKNASASDEASTANQQDSLLTMVNNQQTTIENLRTLVVKLPAEVNPPELEKALDNIQQNNRELNDCVVVLEGENERLRDELEKLSLSQSVTESVVTNDTDKDSGDTQSDKVEEVKEQAVS